MNSTDWTQLVKTILPPLNKNAPKGHAGVVGIIGGSEEKPGPAFLAALGAIKVGADAVHIFCTTEAAPIIKSYSPEVIVHPLLDVPNASDAIQEKLENVHTVLVGVGMGNKEEVNETAASIILYCKRKGKPLVIDDDGLTLVTQRMELIRSYPSTGVILTPNNVEFDRLYTKILTSTLLRCNDKPQIDFEKLGVNVLILKKCHRDVMYSADPAAQWTYDESGSARRCAGQGHVLAGMTTALLHWSRAYAVAESTNPRQAASAAGYAAAAIMRKCNYLAYADRGRNIICANMIEKIPEAFQEVTGHQ